VGKTVNPNNFRILFLEMLPYSSEIKFFFGRYKRQIGTITFRELKYLKKNPRPPSSIIKCTKIPGPLSYTMVGALMPKNRTIQ
jgi:hypothetical protein